MTTSKMLLAAASLTASLYANSADNPPQVHHQTIEVVALFVVGQAGLGHLHPEHRQRHQDGCGQKAEAAAHQPRPMQFGVARM